MAAGDIATKRCTRCSEQKPIDEFNKDRRQPDGLQSKCRSCQSELRRSNYQRNRESEIAKAVQWARSNPEKVKEFERRRAIAKPGRTTEYAKAWALRNRAAEAARKRTWKLENGDKVRAAARAAYARNPHSSLAKYHRRRALKIASGGSYTARQIEALRQKQRGRCACCRKKLARFHADHVVPLVKGGSNDIGNIQLLCPTCNIRKHAKDPILFMQENGFLL